VHTVTPEVVAAASDIARARPLLAGPAAGSHTARRRVPDTEPRMTRPKAEPRVTVTKNGPYLVTGDVPLAKQTIVTDREGGSHEWRESDPFAVQESYACRSV
jgi:hypothetical protein